MALISCKECKNQVSDEAKTCPNCGASVPKPMSRWKWLILGVFTIVVAKCALTERFERPTEPPLSAAQIEENKRQEAEFQFGVIATKRVKNSLKNPASFELVNAGVVTGGALCLTYRATNSFNAVITDQVAIKRNLQQGDWNKECGGRQVSEMNHIKQALD
jgi:hypothetical protein